MVLFPEQRSVEILGITRTAQPQDIKKAYFKLAKMYHPDIYKAANANEKFTTINRAYEVLSDDHKRNRYDNGLSVDEDEEAENAVTVLDIMDNFFGAFGPKVINESSLKADIELSNVLR